jgi:hypothetical protein
MVKYLVFGLIAYAVLSPSKPSPPGGSTSSGGQTPNQNNTGQVTNLVDDFVKAAQTFFQSYGSGSGPAKAQTSSATGPDTSSPNQTTVATV